MTATKDDIKALGGKVESLTKSMTAAQDSLEVSAGKIRRLRTTFYATMSGDAETKMTDAMLALAEARRLVNLFAKQIQGQELDA